MLLRSLCVVVLLIAGSDQSRIKRSQIHKNSRRLSDKENSLLNATCGLPPQPVRGFRNLYGKPVDKGEVPWAVSITYSTKWFPQISDTLRAEYQTTVCSGSLISSRHVLTSAECIGALSADCEASKTKEFYKKNLARFRIYLGGTCARPKRCRELSRDDQLVTAQIAKVFIPQNFTGEKCKSQSSDIAVFELSEDVPFEKNIYPICLSTPELPKTSSELLVAGFGFDNAQLKDYMSQLGVLKTHTQTEVECKDEEQKEHLVCTKDEFTSICNKDNGASVSRRSSSGRQHLVGVAKPTDDCISIMTNHNMGPEYEKRFGPKIVNIHTRVERHLMFICLVSGICPRMEDHIRVAKLLNSTDHRGFHFHELLPLRPSELYAQ